MSSRTKRKGSSSAPSPSERPPDPSDHPQWSRILADAVATPGLIHRAYSRFWNYSVGNQLLAWFQCVSRKLAPGPINTYRGWRECGRHVRKGEKGIALCMPIHCKRRKHAPSDSSVSDQPDAGCQERHHDRGDAERGTDRVGAGEGYTRFVLKSHWFVLAQTDGADYVPAELPTWQEMRALEVLQVTRVPFDHPDGNCQGYARARSIAISPVAFAPHRTLFHELAHVVLGHTAESAMSDGEEPTPRSLREVEAEGVALICCESLGMGDPTYSRGYIQHWLSDEKSIPEKSARRIFKAADQILRAGRPGSTEGGGHGQQP
ncbi:MAG TPA: ArdC-like ssDNA-binding domain-containing protein [Tepidisphaeraceae bacterium]|jgi:antirestriction protein ArdC